ncbi:MAG: hypothetical protein IJI04_04260 [Lachnospiraceae bacterium]|nr:hypothetical protein [Lachnospiraceae bacterium]
MDDEKKVYSFSSEELQEAEELNARANTRMTEEYKQFLEEHFGGEGELYNEHPDRNNSCADQVFSGEYVDRGGVNEELCDECVDRGDGDVEFCDEFVDRGDGNEEPCDEHTDESESGEYSEDGFTRSFSDEYVSNRYEPPTSGSFVMDGDSEDGYNSVDSDFE